MVLSRPPISTFYLNPDISDTALSKLEPEKELNIRDRDFAPNLFESPQNVTSVQSLQLDYVQDYLDSENDNKDSENEVDDYGEILSSKKLPDIDDYSWNMKNFEKIQKSNLTEMNEMLNSFLSYVPKNSLMSKLFNQMSKMLTVSAGSQT